MAPTLSENNDSRLTIAENDIVHLKDSIKGIKMSIKLLDDAFFRVGDDGEKCFTEKLNDCISYIEERNAARKKKNDIVFKTVIVEVIKIIIVVVAIKFGLSR